MKLRKLIDHHKNTAVKRHTITRNKVDRVTEQLNLAGVPWEVDTSNWMPDRFSIRVADKFNVTWSGTGYATTIAGTVGPCEFAELLEKIAPHLVQY